MTITDLKKEFHTYHLPSHWIKDWLLFILNKNATFLITDSDYVLSNDELTAFYAGIKKMQNGIPVQYLTQIAYFWSMPFFVNEHTLIPRADTETLVEIAMDKLKKYSQPITILELGTGSGCIAISLAKSLQKLNISHHITAIDKSTDALAVAQKNANALDANVHFLISDWYQNVVGTFDMIISNPPYIAKDDPHLTSLTAEPISALVSDHNGLCDIEHIIQQGKQHLASGGIIILEHGYDQKQAVQTLFNQYGFYDINTQKDLGGNDRVSYGYHSSSHHS